jgi:hypothetical protein
MNEPMRRVGSEGQMVDLRDYSFGDWFRISLRLAPAFLLATVIILLPVAVVGALVWFMTPL